MIYCIIFFFYSYGDHRDLPVLTHSFPPRRSSDLEALFKHHARELVHARGGGGASGADDFLAHRIDRTDIINNATFELDWEGLALCQHIGDPLMRRIAARPPFAVGEDRKGVGEEKRLSVGVYIGGRRLLKTKKIRKDKRKS